MKIISQHNVCNLIGVLCLISLFVFSLLIPGISHSQHLLFDDDNNCHPRELWSHLIDTLETHGAVIHYVADEGWINLMNMDMVWIHCPENTYSSSIMISLQHFARCGGKIFLGDALSGNIDTLNEFLGDDGWQTTMQIMDTSTVLDEIINNFYQFSPFTDEIEYLILTEPHIILCGNHAYPFAFHNNSFSRAVAAISYPFLQEDNCSSFIVLVTGIHSWETGCHWANPEVFHFATNIFLCLAGITGFELESCAVPKTPDNFCKRVPNPFTPNNDGFNDYVQFEFDNMGQTEGTIYIYDIHNHEVKQINVPAGANAKTAAQWHGTDNNGNPLPQGVYMYVIESGGEIVCEGTVVIAR